MLGPFPHDPIIAFLIGTGSLRTADPGCGEREREREKASRAAYRHARNRERETQGKRQRERKRGEEAGMYRGYL